MPVAKRKGQMVGLGLFGADEAPAPTPQPLTLFQQADALLASKGWPQDAIHAFNLFLGAYCKKRGKPTLTDVEGWVALLERYREWKFGFDDLVYLLTWCRQSEKFYLTLPPEMRAGGNYWFNKGQVATQGAVKAGKVY